MDGCELTLLALDVAVGSLGGEGLDSADTRGDTALAGNLKEPDISRGPGVRAPTELHTIAHHNQADVMLRVLFTEYRLGARGKSLLQAHVGALHGAVGLDKRVYDFLDALELALGDAGEMGEIEPKPRRLDEASGLLDVIAEHLAQGQAEQMRTRVVSNRGGPALFIHLSGDGIPHRKAAACHRAAKDY